MPVSLQNLSFMHHKKKENQHNLGGRKKVCACGGSLKPLSETPPPPFRAPVTGIIPKPPNPQPPVVVLMSGHFERHPMEQRKMEDVAPHLGLPLAQTTRM